MNFFFKLIKKRGTKETNTSYEVKTKKIRGVSFVDWRSFKTNKSIILFCMELVSRSRNLNQRKSRSLLEVERHLNVEV